MTTALLQCLIAVLKLGFGATGLRIAHATRAEGVGSTAWLLVGIAFVAGGINSVMHAAWAVWALLAGPGSGIYAEYLRWAPAVNYSRHAVMLALALLLLGLPLLHRLPRAALCWGTGALLLGSSLMGGWGGSREGEDRWIQHYTTTAALDSVEMILLAAALLAAVVLGSMDRLLWIALAVYTIRQAINALYFSAIAWIEVPGAWSPSPQHIAWTGSLLWTLLLALAIRRLWLAARGHRPPGMLEPLAGRAHSAVR